MSIRLLAVVSAMSMFPLAAEANVAGAAPEIAAPAATAPAGTAAPAPAPIRAAQNDAGANRPICKREEEIGTRLGGTRICHTRAQWDEISHYAADRLRASQALGNHMSPNGTGSGHP
jgi:hypothetical protein